MSVAVRLWQACSSSTGMIFMPLRTVIGEGEGNALGCRRLVPNLLEEGGVVREHNDLCTDHSSYPFDFLKLPCRHLCGVSIFC